MQLQNNIKLDYLEYTAKQKQKKNKKKKWKRYNFSKYSLPTICLRNIPEGNLPLQDVDEEQNLLVNESKDMGKGKIPVEKKIFFKECSIIS